MMVLCLTPEEWRTIFSGITASSVFLAVLSYWLARNKAKSDSDLLQDKEICEQAIKALERAFLSLTGEKGTTEAPESSRLNWLTTARRILKFKEMKDRLKTDLYKSICSEHQEHWRHQFYLCLEYQEFSFKTYYQAKDIAHYPANNPLLYVGETIEPKSALIIVNFTKWPADLEDPINKVDESKLINDGYTLKGHSGLEDYLNELNDKREAIKSEREARKSAS